MHRLGIRILPAASLFGVGGSDTVTPTETQRNVRLEKCEGTPMERLRTMFYADKYGDYSPDLAFIANTSIFGTFCGALYGGYMKSRHVYIDFIEKNKATAFRNHLDAKSALTNKIYTSYGTGAFQAAWRIGLFTFVYVSSTSVLSVLRGKEGILEYSGAGALCGALFRLHFGVVGVAVGCGLGCVLGTFAGALRAGACWLTGVNMDEVKSIHQKWRNSQIESEMQEIGKYKRKEEMHALVRVKVEQEMAMSQGVDDLGKVETDVSQSGSESISNPVIDKIQKQDNK